MVGRTNTRNARRQDHRANPTSDYSSAIVVAGKKDENYRFCVDYRRLNEQTVDAPQCLPRIHEILKDLGDTTIFSSHTFSFRRRDRRSAGGPRY